MSNSITSVARSLRLIFIENILVYALVNSKATIKHTGAPIYVNIIPGSLIVSDATKNGNTDVYDKKIIFKIAKANIKMTDRLSFLAKYRFIAMYIDATGNERISGTKNYSLSLSFNIVDGIYNCTLSGTATDVDAFNNV